MKEVIDFVENFLQHEYDPVKAREYYLRTRKLKGRRKTRGKINRVDDRSRRMYNGGTLKKIGQRMEEDETPNVSPNGAKLSDYDGGGLGRATYADGSVYDARSGWSKVSSKVARAQRISEARKKIQQAKALAENMKDSQKKRDILQRLNNAERKVTTAKRKRTIANSPVLRRQSGA